MNNKVERVYLWEKEFEKVAKSFPCPCGKGSCEVAEIEYNDDYLNWHTGTTTRITCRHCEKHYKYLGEGKWIRKKMLKY